MLPSISASSKSRWQRSSRRISMISLPTIGKRKSKSALQKAQDSPLSAEDPIPPDPEPSQPLLPDIRVVNTSLCIDNRYFVNYVDEEPKEENVEYLTKAFRSFARVQGDLNRRRQNYFEKRGLEDAIQLNINQQNDKIGQAIECLAVCEEITKKYNCSLKNSFQILVDEFASKCFKLTSLTAQLHALRQTHTANLMVRNTEKSRTAEIEWRIDREQRRIAHLDAKIAKIYENRDNK